MGTGGERVQRSIEAIRQDRDHGAAHLAEAAVRTLAQAAESCPPGRRLDDWLRETARALGQARPAMAPLKTAAARTLAEAEAEGLSPASVGRAAERVIKRLRSAGAKAAVQCAALLPDRAVVLTCSYSATVVSALASARRAGKAPRVVAVSWPEAGADYGDRMATALRAEGVDARLCVAQDLAQEAASATLALVGADRVLPNGSLVNGVPTLALARAVRGAAPLWAACDSFKLDPDPAAHLEPGFELVPPDLVGLYITELGMAAPTEVGTLRPDNSQA